MLEAWTSNELHHQASRPKVIKDWSEFVYNEEWPSEKQLGKEHINVLHLQRCNLTITFPARSDEIILICATDIDDYIPGEVSAGAYAHTEVVAVTAGGDVHVQSAVYG